jgi:hypothetical protein
MVDGTPAAPEPIKMAILVRQTVRPADYETAEVSIHLSGITTETTDEEIDELIEERSKIVIQKLAQRVGREATAARNRGGWPDWTSEPAP